MPASLALLLLPLTVLAQVPGKLGFQGQLKNADGSPMSGTVSVTFRIYSVPTGGAALFTETQTLSLSSGFYSTQLGASTSGGVPSILFDGGEKFVEVSVGPTVLAPRQKIGSVAYAMQAGGLNKAASIDIDGTAKIAGNVGIGTTSPTFKLDVAGDVQTSGRININNVAADEKLRWNRTGGNIFSLEHDAGRFYFYNRTSAASALAILNNGNVGIGTNFPAARLDVQAAGGYGLRLGDTGGDSINAYSPGGMLNKMLHLNYSSTGGVSLAYGGGNVGIGTATPGDKLTVVGGNINVSGNRITNVATPAAGSPGTDVATKEYVDSKASGSSGATMVAAIDPATTGTTNALPKYQSFTPSSDASATAVIVKMNGTGAYSVCDTESCWTEYDAAAVCLYDASGDAPATLMAGPFRVADLGSTLQYVRFNITGSLPLRAGTKYVLKVAVNPAGNCASNAGVTWTWALSPGDILSGGRSQVSATQDYLFYIEGAENTVLGFVDGSTTGTSSAAPKYQSFTPQRDMMVGSVSVKMSGTGAYSVCDTESCWTENDDAAVCIYDSTTTDSPGTLMAGPYRVIDLGSSLQYTRFAFTNPLALRAGMKYVVRVAVNPAGDCTSNAGVAWTWALSAGDALSGGRSQPSATQDYIFFIEGGRGGNLGAIGGVMKVEIAGNCGTSNQPAACPSGWTNLGSSTVYRGAATGCERTCYRTDINCLVMPAEIAGNCGTSNQPVACPSGWTNLGSSTVYRGNTATGCIRTCYKCG